MKSIHNKISNKKDLEKLKDFSKLYKKYKLLDFENLSKSDFTNNCKLIGEAVKILLSLTNVNPDTPTTFLTYQVVSEGFIKEDKYIKIQLNLKEWQSRIKGADDNEQIISLRNILRVLTGFNEDEL